MAATTDIQFPPYVPGGGLLPQDDYNPLLRWGELSGDPWEQSLFITVIVGSSCFCIIQLVNFLISRGASRRTSWLSWLLVARRYALVMQCADVIHACANARRTGGERKALMLRKVSKRLKVVLRNVAGAHRSRGSVPRLSYRRKPLKQHARHVSAALRALETNLDTNSDDALRDIADTLLTISDRYCHARLGALLEEAQLEGVDPLPDRDLLRWIAALVLAAGSVTGLALTGAVPEAAEPFVYPLTVLAALTVAFRRNVQRAIEVLGAITGAA
ncbi:hypothetical protein ACFV2X_53025 [Streptomyces sp. NPDC059679]|uniref:hypothetical protein n=1 Tax=Streptomyces sp. NPDC059679 TaxID=3346903 RepID=UPI0036CA9ABB